MSLVKMMDRGLSLANNAHESSASPATIRVLDAKGESANASLKDGARNANDVGPRYVGIGHAVVA